MKCEYTKKLAGSSICMHILVFCSNFGQLFVGTRKKHETRLYLASQSGPEVIKLFPCSTQLSMKFFLLINVKMPTNVGILTFMNVKNSIISLSEPKKC